MKFTKMLMHYITKYFLGFLIVFLSSILVAFVASRSIEDYIIEKGEMKNQEGINGIYEMVNKMELINEMMAKNQTFSTIVYQQGKIPKEDVLKLKEANKMFSEIGFVADYTPYVFMLFKKNDLYLSTSQCSFNFQDYYNKFLRIQREGADFSDSDAVRDELFGRYAKHSQFVRLDQIRFIYNEKERKLQDAILYLTSSELTRLNPQYLSCFVIDRDYLIKSIMMPELEKDGFLYIQDSRTGDVLLEYGNVPEGIGAYENGQVVGDGGSYRLIVKQQDDLQWKIVTGIPMAFIDSQIWPVSRLLIIYLCIGLLLVIGLTAFYSYQQYSGMKRVLFALPAENGVESSKKRFDEYGILTDNILALKKNGNEYRAKMEELAKQNEAMMLEHLIVMGIWLPEERRVFEKCFEKVPEFFCVAVVRLQQKEYGNSDIITLAMVEYLKKHYPGKFTNVYSGLTDELFLFELKPEQEANVSGIKKLFEEVAVMVTAAYDVILHVGISAIGTDLANVNKCYEQARQVVRAQYACSNENVVKTYDISANALYENPVNMDFLNHFYTLLICGQQEEICTQLDKVESYYSRMPYLYEAQKEQIFYSIRNILYSAWLHLDGETDSRENFPVFQKNLKCGEMMEMLRRSSDELCDFISQTKRSKNEGLKEKITQYLNSHYEEAGLSAYRASSEIGISEKYLSQFLKEQTGETFSSYLLRLRIEKAKELLATTDYSNDKIAQMTGFGAVNTFYRNFSKQVGVTPKVYKENCEAR